MDAPLHRYKRPIVATALDERIVDVAVKMRDGHVGCVIAVRGARPIGILTDRDIVMRVVAEGRDPATTRVADVVTYDPIVVSSDEGLETVVATMRAHGIRRVPIVDENGDLFGLVTADDVTMLTGRELGSLADAIESASDASESR